MPVFESTALSRAEYNPSTRTLSIWFTGSGGPYDYYDVPAAVYAGLCAADSKGTYFNQHIRDRYSVSR